MSKSLKKLLKKIVAKDIHEELAVADAKLGGVIKVRKCCRILKIMSLSTPLKLVTSAQK